MVGELNLEGGKINAPDTGVRRKCIFLFSPNISLQNSRERGGHTEREKTRPPLEGQRRNVKSFNIGIVTANANLEVSTHVLYVYNNEHLKTKSQIVILRG